MEGNSMKYKECFERPRNDIRKTKAGKSCPECNKVFWHKFIDKILKCNNCGYTLPVEKQMV
jgi:ribosomal protein L37AE/L43A